MTSHSSTAAIAVGARCGERTVQELLERYWHHLIARGHAASTVHAYTDVLDHFLRWLACEQVDIVAMERAHIAEFLEHLPRCRCATPAARNHKTVRAAVHQFFNMLGRSTRPPSWSRTTAEVVADFDTYMETVAGLAEVTRLHRRRQAGDFLEYHFAGGPVALQRLRPAAVRAYVARRAQGLAPGSVSSLGTALRSFLRYAQLCGRCAAELALAVPGPTACRQSHPPRALAAELVERLLASFDPSLSTGRRDYAMCRCLVDLGMRTSDVAHLRLDDLDWRRGTIHVPAGKSRRANTLPLSPETGQAITDYVLGARPTTTSRALFVHHRHRSGQPIVATTVRGAIRRGFARAGIAPEFAQVHRLRHSTATRLLERGASFKAIADILCHTSFDTTARYLSVDTRGLQDVAMPWPGGER